MTEAPEPSIPGASVAPRSFYHGYVMLPIAMIIAICTMPGQSVLVALFNEPIREALGIKLATLSLCYTIGTIAAAFPLVYVGRLADRFGLRVVVGTIALLFAGGLWILSLAQNPIGLTIGFFLIRMLGQGALGMLTGHILAMWFERKLGTMDAVKSVGFAIGAAVLPAPTAWLITEVGWRDALPILGAGMLLVVLPLVLTIFRNKPEDIGQHLDGDPVEHATHDVLHGGAPPPGDPAFTLRQALTTRAFWILVGAMVGNGLIGTAVIFQIQPILASAGADPLNAPKAMAPWPIASAITVLLGGWLADRVHAARLLWIGPAGCGLASLIWYAAVSNAVALPPVTTVGIGMAVLGVSMGSVMGVGQPTLARYFGRTHHGSIRGFYGMLMVAGTGVGPTLAGMAYEFAGQTFGPILIAFAIACVPMALFTLTLRRPERPTAQGEGLDCG
ncbi:MAG: hypothetical protein CMJ31_00010 [Phycisphaerae bacterium]|nr:hypothetical protein [Phycisphaerae bacterium]